MLGRNRSPFGLHRSTILKWRKGLSWLFLLMVSLLTLAILLG